MRNAVAALVRNDVFVVGALVARGGNDLHKRRLVILFRDIGPIYARRDMHRLVCGAQRKPHRKPYALSGNLPFAVNALSVTGHFVRGYFKRYFFQFVRGVVRFVRHARDLRKYFSS